MGLGWLTDVAGAALDWFATDEANSANARALESQMAFNREVMQNRHQWEVEDLRKAGLNPLMSTTSPTGTLSAPNSSPAQKANLAQSAAAFANIDIARKNAEAQLNSSKADLANARTNEINANTAKAAMENDVIRAQNDFRIASEQINIAERDLDLRKRLADADVDLKTAQSVFQKIQNFYAPKIQQAELDYRVQQIMLEAATAYASIELMRKQGNMADAQALESSTRSRLNIEMAGLTDSQRRQIDQQIDFAQKDYDAGEVQRAITREKDYREFLFTDSPAGAFADFIGFGVSRILGPVGAGVRIGKGAIHSTGNVN